MIKIGVCMPAINLWNRYTRPAMVSILKATGEAFAKGIESEILLIDNASTDETRIESENWNMHIQLFEYHRNKERWGFQKSVNFGVNHFLDKQFDYVLVLNNDILLHKNAIWRLVDRFRRGGVGMVTCMDVRGECNDNPANFAKMNDLDKVSVSESEHPNFSAFMVNRECWKTVGEMDMLFAPAYWEDNDMHYRMKLAGVKAVCYPPALFFHWGSKTQNEALGNGNVIVSGPMFENNRARYISKWGGVPGSETFTHPFNSSHLPITKVKQHE